MLLGNGQPGTLAYKRHLALMPFGISRRMTNQADTPRSRSLRIFSRKLLLGPPPRDVPFPLVSKLHLGTHLSVKLHFFELDACAAAITHFRAKQSSGSKCQIENVRCQISRFPTERPALSTLVDYAPERRYSRAG